MVIQYIFEQYCTGLSYVDCLRMHITSWSLSRETRHVPNLHRKQAEKYTFILLFFDVGIIVIEQLAQFDGAQL